MNTYETYIAELKESEYDFITATKCSDGRAWVTLSKKGIDKDTCEVVCNMITLEDGTVVHLSILSNEDCGWGSVPVKSDLLGHRVGTMHLSHIMRVLPEVYLDKVKAETYLANNPEMLISKLSNVLNIQKRVMSEQQHALSDLDHWVSCIYEDTTNKTKRFMELVLTKTASSWGLKKLSKVLNKPVDTE